MRTKCNGFDNWPACDVEALFSDSSVLRRCRRPRLLSVWSSNRISRWLTSSRSFEPCRFYFGFIFSFYLDMIKIYHGRNSTFCQRPPLGCYPLVRLHRFFLYLPNLAEQATSFRVSRNLPECKFYRASTLPTHAYTTMKCPGCCGRWFFFFLKK